MPAWVIPAIAAASIGAGTIARDDAADRREGALTRVTRQREGNVQNINDRRQALLTMAMDQLPGFAGRQQGLLSSAISGTGQQGQVMQQGTQEGRERILGSLAGMGLGSATPNPVGGFGTGGGARAALAAEGRPLTQALQGLSASGMGQVAGQRHMGGVLRDLQLGQTGLRRDVGDMTSNLAVGQSRLGLMDLLNNLYTQQRLQSASQVGDRTDAVGQGLQSLGGGLLQGGMQGMFG